MMKIFYGLTAFLLSSFLGVAVAIQCFSLEDYRKPLADVLSHDIARTVSLDGAMHFGLTRQGLIIRIENVSVQNPTWARYPQMAVIGKMELGINLLPLLHHKIVITTLTIDQALLGFEISDQGDSNWPVFDPQITFLAGSKELSPDVNVEPLVTIHIDHLSFLNSQLVMVDHEGVQHLLKVNHLILHGQDAALEARFDSSLNGLLMQGSLLIGVQGEKKDRPITLDATYDFYHVLAQGRVNLFDKMVKLDSYQIRAGSSLMGGVIYINGAGPRVQLKGTITGQHILFDDYLSAGPSDTNNKLAAPSSALLSNSPLGLAKLKMFDAKIDVDLKNVIFKGATIDSVKGQANLQDGYLSVPLKLMFGRSSLYQEVQLNALTFPIQMGIKVVSYDVDFADLLGLLNIPAILSGPGDVRGLLVASGDSLQALIGSLTGAFDIMAEDGQVSSKAADQLSSSLVKMFAPEGVNSFNCFAARFILNNGIMRDNGFLVNTPLATIAGKGVIDFNNETLNMTLHAQTTLINFGGFVPPLLITGTLSKPHFSLDIKALFRNVIDVLSGRGAINQVPDIMAVPGQNACLYTLQHSASTMDPLTMTRGGFQGWADRAVHIGQQLMKGVFGHP